MYVRNLRELELYRSDDAVWLSRETLDDFRDSSLRRIEYGDPEAMEAAICFLEVRPYFFRSGYMFWDILRKCRKAPLSRAQAKRLSVVEKKVLEWRERKQAKRR
jgi:hypothetical protein